MNRVRKAVFSEAVHKQGILGKGIGVAIVDTGLFPHPDYRSRITGIRHRHGGIGDPPGAALCAGGRHGH